MVGAWPPTGLPGADRRELEAVLPHLARGAAVLTRVLYRRPSTRPAIAVVPSIVDGTTSRLLRYGATGRPITRQIAARVMADQTRGVLVNPRRCRRAFRRNVVGTRAVHRARHRRHGYGGTTRMAPRRRYPYGAQGARYGRVRPGMSRPSLPVGRPTRH